MSGITIIKLIITGAKESSGSARMEGLEGLNDEAAVLKMRRLLQSYLGAYRKMNAFRMLQ
jgi:hypothetical protein